MYSGTLLPTVRAAGKRTWTAFPGVILTWGMLAHSTVCRIERKHRQRQGRPDEEHALRPVVDSASGAGATRCARHTATLKELSDTAMLAVLLGTGLRRSETAALTVAHLQQRDGGR